MSKDGLFKEDYNLRTKSHKNNPLRSKYIEQEYHSSGVVLNLEPCSSQHVIFILHQDETALIEISITRVPTFENQFISNIRHRFHTLCTACCSCY